MSRRSCAHGRHVKTASDADSSRSRASFTTADVVSPASSVTRSTSLSFLHGSDVTLCTLQCAKLRHAPRCFHAKTRSSVPSAPPFAARAALSCNQPSPGRPHHQRQDTLNGAFCSTPFGRAPVHVSSPGSRCGFPKLLK